MADQAQNLGEGTETAGTGEPQVRLVDLITQNDWNQILGATSSYDEISWIYKTLAGNLDKIKIDIFSGNEHQEFLGCRLARNILGMEGCGSTSFDKIIAAGIVPKFIQLLKCPNAETQYEAVWVVVNIAAGTQAQTNHIIGNGGIEPLIEILSSTHDVRVIENAVYGLGNLAAEPNIRDLLISKGIVPILISLLQQPKLASNIAFSFCNLCRQKDDLPPLSAEVTREIIPAIGQLLMVENNDVIMYAGWALSFLSNNGSVEMIEGLLLAAGDPLLPRLVQLLNSAAQNKPHSRIIGPCLRTIGNILAGNHLQTQRVLDSGPIIEALEKLLQNHSPDIVKVVAWACSNIAAGTVPQVNALVTGNLIPPLLHVIYHGEPPVQCEATWCITNITARGTMGHLTYLHQNAAIPALCSILCKEPKSIGVAMVGLENMLRRTGEVGVGELKAIKSAIDECGGLEILEALQNHESEAIYKMAYRLVETYFIEEESEEDEEPPTHVTEEYLLMVQNILEAQRPPPALVENDGNL